MFTPPPSVLDPFKTLLILTLILPLSVNYLLSIYITQLMHYFEVNITFDD